MNQVSVFEAEEITAYGIFSINLNLVITVSTNWSSSIKQCRYLVT